MGHFIKKRDPITGRILNSGRKRLPCDSCSTEISESSYYSGKRRCRECYFKSRAKGRTPNIECSLCKIPLYRPPNVINKTKTFSCSKCKDIVASERMKSNPQGYRSMVAKAIEKRGTGKKHFCLDCGILISKSGKKCGSCARSGVNNYNWKGGVTNKQRMERTKFSTTVGQDVLLRDNYTCQMCGSKKDLQVDHIQSWKDYVELRFSMDNCRTLCRSCHYKITWGKEMPTDSIWGKPRQCRKESDYHF